MERHFVIVERRSHSLVLWLNLIFVHVCLFGSLVHHFEILFDVTIEYFAVDCFLIDVD